MSWIKKVIIAVIIVALVTGAAAGGLFYMKKMNQKEVMVVNVSSITGVYYSSDTTLDGQISTSVSQNITVDSDMIIDNVYVQKGSQVAVGDPLISFDTTLVEMELNIAKLKKQKQEQDLTKAVNRLNSLKNGGPIDDPDSTLSTYNADNLSNSSSDNNSGSDEELTPVTSAKEKNSGAFLASVMQPFLLTGIYDESIFGDGSSSQEENITDSEEDNIFDSGDTANGNDAAPAPTPTPTPALDADTDYYDPYFTEGPKGTEDLHDGNPEFYTKLNGDSVPFTGTGTEEDPFVFFCGSAKGQVTVTGAFLNKMAGYDADGLNILKEGGYWYQLEFHQNDTVADFSDRKQSCIGYYLVDGSMLEKPVDMLVETEFTIEGASQYDDNSGQDEYPGDGGSSGTGGGSTATMTREEAIKVQQNKISSLKLDIEESDIEIAKLEKKAERKIVYSKLDGTVSYVGDSTTGNTDGNAFIVVQSKDGFYVKGSISELMLDKIKEGMTLNCTSYSENSMGSFEAEVIDVADYPVSSSSYYGTGNPNVSYYSFSAVVTDKSLKFSDMEYVTITLPSEELNDGSFVLQREFVRTEDGNNYVYKDDNGVLKKQLISVGGNVNGGYYVLVKGGLSMDDKVAFPYGSDVKEGVKTREATVEELYGY